jgi:hypothetical protein
MICFEIFINGEKFCVAGTGEFGVLAAHVTWSQRSPKEGFIPESEPETPKSRLHIGGLVDQEHVRWTKPSHFLNIEDEVTFRIIESNEADPPAYKHSQNSPERREQKRYEQYQLLKREFEGDESTVASRESDAEETMRLKTRLMLEYKEEIEAWKQRQKQQPE